MNAIFTILAAITFGNEVPPHSIVRKGDQVALRVPADVCLSALSKVPYRTSVSLGDRFTTITVSA